jgi:hypothetical protein
VEGTISVMIMSIEESAVAVERGPVVVFTY